MTTAELNTIFNNTFRLGQWPETYEVDHETYACVIQDILDHHCKNNMLFWDVVIDGEQKPDEKSIWVAVGKHNGIMFKNVELILKSREIMK